MVTAIIQARMGSTRLPGKVMMPIEGKPLLYYVINQVRHSKKLSNIIVATTNLKEDEIIVNFVNSLGVDCYVGNAQDVLDRYYCCAKEFKIDVIVRISGDSPLIDYNIIDKCIDEFEKNHFDYLGNTIVKDDNHWIENYNGFPIGVAVEVFTFNALEKAWKESKKPSDREHVTEYIWKNPEIFKLGSIKNSEDLSNMRIVVDYQEDFNLVKKIIEHLPSNDALTLEQIISFLKENPEFKK